MELHERFKGEMFYLNKCLGSDSWWETPTMVELLVKNINRSQIVGEKHQQWLGNTDNGWIVGEKHQ